MHQKKLKTIKMYGLIINNLPTKFLTFNGLKWQKIKDQLQRIKKKLEKKSNFKGKVKIRKKKQKWKKRFMRYKKNAFIVNPLAKLAKLVRIKKRVKSLQQKNLFKRKLGLFFNGYKNTLNSKKAIISKMAKIKNYLLKPYFHMNVLIWSLHFSPSRRSASQMIMNKKHFVSTGKLLTKGNFFHLTKYYLKTLNAYKFSRGNNIWSMLEIDYYTSNLIVIKDLAELTLNDCYLQVGQYVSLFSISRFK